ncbi:cytidine deaminase [Thermosyntropha lipolytica DSM 11003]|uniref:Cytidine deaminase n=1 Tax=Thermosyntropha lipolytica DSM 11003 TaxID=1123382 RepID=A0A1M5NAP9_9FIRM|nr:cytidine deaminase [Thermosyntropha lipolytica]SHG86073.1 cytidine deaminase [Thermosyntropha lipolytica DSM 11003]
MDIKLLIKEAREAQKYAYAPYSRFKVGAALLTKKGRVYKGANIENASYGLTVCAERVAVFKAVSEGELDWEGICVVSSGSGFAYPCGACLQVLSEFASELKVVVADENNFYQEFSLRDLFPTAFCLDKQEG